MSSTNSAGSRPAFTGSFRFCLLGLFLLTAVLTAFSRGQTDQGLPDPVDEFRRALRIDATDAIRIRDLDFKEKAVRENKQIQYIMEYRTKNLRSIAARARSLGDLNRILLLQNWLDVDRDNRKELLDLVGAKTSVRRELLDRFAAESRQALRSPNPAVQAATAAMLREANNLVRKQESRQADFLQVLSALTPDLVQLTENANPTVRAEAALALGQVQAPPADVVPPLAELLKPKYSATVRRAAAQGLSDQMQFLVKKATPSGDTIGLLRDRKPDDLINLPMVQDETRDYSILILQALSALKTGGLADPDDEIRLLCASTCEVIATGFQEMAKHVSGSDLLIDLPARDRKVERKISNKDRETIRAATNRARSIFERFSLLLQAFQKAAPALARASTDGNEAIRLAALNALEEVAGGRRRLRNMLDVIPLLPKSDEEEEKDKEKDKNALGGLYLPDVPAEAAVRSGRVDFHLTARQAPEKVPLPEVAGPTSGNQLLQEPPETLQALVRDLLTSPDPPSRIQAACAIEQMGRQGEPAIPALIKALCDPNMFVRWASARTLGRLAPSSPETVVPALVRLLEDPEIDVVQAVATALERYGLLARPAIAALARVVETGDGEGRIAAMKALVAAGTSAASAVPQIALALTDPNVRVRREAAQSLGRFGPLAREAIPALRTALTDLDVEVRKDAADALIKVVGK